MLASAGISNRQHFTRCLRTNQVDAWVLHGELRTNVAIDPLHVAFCFNAGTLGDQVVHVWRPVLNGGVGNAGTWLHHNFDYCRVQ